MVDNVTKEWDSITQTLLILFSSFHLYSSIGGVDKFYLFVLRKACKIDKKNSIDSKNIGDSVRFLSELSFRPLVLRLDDDEKKREVEINKKRGELVDPEQSYFGQFFFESHFLPTAHFTLFICLLLFLAQGGITQYSWSLIIYICVFYPISCFFMECLLIKSLKKRWTDKINPKLRLLSKKKESTMILPLKTSEISIVAAEAPMLTLREAKLEAEKMLRNDDFDKKRHNKFTVLNTLLLVLILVPILIPQYIIIIVFVFFLFFLASLVFSRKFLGDISYIFLKNRYGQLIVIFSVFIVNNVFISEPFVYPPFDLNWRNVFPLLFGFPYLLDVLIILQKDSLLKKCIIDDMYLVKLLESLDGHYIKHEKSLKFEELNFTISDVSEE